MLKVGQIFMIFHQDLATVSIIVTKFIGHSTLLMISLAGMKSR